MFIAGFIFIAGVAFCAAAQNLAMLIFGGASFPFRDRTIKNTLSIGYTVPAEYYPWHSLSQSCQLCHQQDRIKGGWGWRLSLGLGGLPALLLTLGAFLVVDTPNSLIERGHLEEGKSVLRKIRGIDNIEPEFLELLDASRVAKEVKHPFRNILKRRNRSQLVISIALQVFQQFTGINVISLIMFYAPILFNTLGFKNDASLYSAVITGAINMFLSHVVIAVVMGIKMKDHPEELSKGYAVLVVVMVCICMVMGPLGWFIPSEIFPLETRSVGQGLSVCVNFLFTFVIGQAVFSMLCLFRFGIFFFFSGWILIMSTFVLFLFPETKNVPIEEIAERVWKQHWLWKRFIDEDDCVKEEKVVTGN
ncbi:Sugar transport protein 13 [Glycine soja]|uniref:Sugar transport protein 13 n=1 Tax=Glycine soja TaxID=3848 RepID=A0A445F512_GLYSO|nr:Sugar transport protein 13 [Glycine soja]